MKEYIDVRVTTNQLKESLKSRMNDKFPHKDLIVNTIIENLAESEMGLSHLYNAFSGVSPTVHVKIGDDVLVNYDHLSTWRMNRDAMQQNGQMEKGFVKCIVHEINVNRVESIIVTYTAYDDKGGNIASTYSLSPDKVHLNNEEYPEGF